MSQTNELTLKIPLSRIDVPNLAEEAGIGEEVEVVEEVDVVEEVEVPEEVEVLVSEGAREGEAVTESGRAGG